MIETKFVCYSIGSIVRYWQTNELKKTNFKIQNTYIFHEHNRDFGFTLLNKKRTMSEWNETICLRIERLSFIHKIVLMHI